jgi:MFS family permease
VTSYNAAVALVALALVLFVHRLDAARVLAVGLVVFLLASLACSLAGGLAFLVAARGVQGIGAALLLAGSLPVLAALTGSAVRGGSVWTLAGTFGAALGPALGGMLTQAFDWRAIFAAQAPVAALALIAAVRVRPKAAPPAKPVRPRMIGVAGEPPKTAAPAKPARPLMVGVASERLRPVLEEGWRPSLARTLPANTCLGLVFGALVGALFLAVLLVISAWSYSPIGGALVVSMLPAAALAARPLALRLPRLTAVWGGAALLAGGLAGLALLPSASVGFALCALSLCGAGLGLAVPFLSDAALVPGPGLTRSATLTIGIRHLGLVLALASIAPIVASELPPAGDRALLKATAVLLDAPVGLDKKVPVALDLRGAFAEAQAGETPNLAEPFNAHGAGHDSALASARDDLVGTIETTITRAFRPAFFFSAALAALAVPVALVFRRRVVS